MTIRKTKYVAASDINEAWMRFRAKLYSSDREDAQETAELLEERDSCDEKCKYSVYEIHVDIHLDDGPETECQGGDEIRNDSHPSTAWLA
jgi:hypothetical protein